MTGYIGNTELWYKNIDTSFIGIENAEPKVRLYHLCPYSTVTIRVALSFKGTKQRIELVDKAISECLKL
jgi:hypothetical protein